MRRLELAVLAVLSIPALAQAQVQQADAPTQAAPPAASTATATATSSSSSSSGSSAAAIAAGTAPAAEGLHLSLDLDHSVGSGTFVNSATYAYFGGSLLILPSYSFAVQDVKLSASGRFVMGWEYTLPDAENARRFDWTDLKLGLAAPGVFKEKFTDISISPSIGVLVPLSLGSFRASTITVLSAGLGLARTVGSFDLAYKFAAGRGFHQSQIIGERIDPDSTANPQLEAQTEARIGAFARDGETVSNVFGTNTQFSLSNSIDVTYRATEKVSFAVGLGLVNSFRYAQTDAPDEYTSEKLDANGKRVADAGFGRADKMTSYLSAAYQMNDQLSISAGVGVGAPGVSPLNSDRSFRVPFLSYFWYPEDNLLSYSLTLSAAY